MIHPSKVQEIPILGFNHVTKIYTGLNPVIAVNDVTFEINKGSFVAITGPSGSGKTSLLNLASFIDTPSSGDLTFEGVNSINLSKTELAAFRNRNIGIVFQSHYLLPEFTIKENILLPLWISKQPRSVETDQWFNFLVNKVGIEDLLSKFPYEVSTGQAQRVAITRALINKPSVLFADEPASNLDSKLTSALYQLLEDLNNDLGITIVVITHNLQILDRFERILYIEDGEIISDKREVSEK